MAARKSANVGWYFPYTAVRLVNRQNRSIRFRFGEYDGRNSNSIPSPFANPFTRSFR